MCVSCVLNVNVLFFWFCSFTSPVATPAASCVFNVSNSPSLSFSISRCPTYLCFPTIEGKWHFQPLGGEFILCGSTSRIWHALEVENISFDLLEMVVCKVPRQRPAGHACHIATFWREAHHHFHSCKANPDHFVWSHSLFADVRTLPF